MRYYRIRNKATGNYLAKHKIDNSINYVAGSEFDNMLKFRSLRSALRFVAKSVIQPYNDFPPYHFFGMLDGHDILGLPSNTDPGFVAYDFRPIMDDLSNFIQIYKSARQTGLEDLEESYFHSSLPWFRHMLILDTSRQDQMSSDGGKAFVSNADYDFITNFLQNNFNQKNYQCRCSSTGVEILFKSKDDMLLFTIGCETRLVRFYMDLTPLKFPYHIGLN